MKLTSSAFEHQGKIPTQYTCDGLNISPPLAMSDVPDGAKSLVLIMDDPDVPKNIREDGMWDHWIVFNISPAVSNVPENEEPAGLHGVGTGGNLEYSGPCPPDGEHGYRFKLFALDLMLKLEEGCSKSDVETGMKGHVVEDTILVGHYNRT